MQHNHLMRIGCDSFYRIGNGLRGIRGRGENFKDLQCGVVQPDAISEGAAAIDGDSERSACSDKRFLRSSSHSGGFILGGASWERSCEYYWPRTFPRTLMLPDSCQASCPTP